MITPERQKYYSTLSFTYEFEYDFDTVSMAFSQPYTYTDLRNDLKQIENNPQRFKYVTRETLCYTLAGTPCELLTITSPNRKIKNKKGIVFTARVHPGETVGSWMLKGVIDFLVSDDINADILRNFYVFKIVPMLNPDGVIQGNYRCSLAGCDLNRRYSYPSRVFHPTIFYLKEMTKQLSKKYPLALYCDFHGHSKKKNVFMYGNTSEENPEQYRIFPYIMSRVYPYFSFKSSQFGVHKSKSSTARVAMWREYNISSVFTIEASFLGPNDRKEEPQFRVQDLMEIGKGMCQALNIYDKIIAPEHEEILNPYLVRLV